MELLVVSHYTKGTGYEQEVQKLISSLKSLGLSYAITAIQTQGSWRANSNWCAINVQRALSNNPNHCVLRVDADAIFHERPMILEAYAYGTTCDVAAHVHDFPWRKNELLGGTLYFDNNPRVHALVNQWVELACHSHRKGERNGDLLQELLMTNSKVIRFRELPPQYCKIFDKMQEVEDPVIEHFQASRRFRRNVNAMGVPSNVTTRLETFSG